jgi:erythromycin esterase-like protein
MTELDLVRLRELAAELGYWPASTDEEHVARLRAQYARYDEQVAQDPGGTKWQKMMGAWVTQVNKLSVQDRKDRLSDKYGHLRTAAAERAEEDQRIAEANRRSKERPTRDAQVITVAVDEVPRGRSNER